MGFKLGNNNSKIASEGTLDSKFHFKQDHLVGKTPIYNVPLAKGIAGEANADGSIYLAEGLDPESEEGRLTIAHEMKHLTDMKIGKLSYGDDYVRWNGQTYPRKDGKILFEGEWLPEGGEFPWENHG